MNVCFPVQKDEGLESTVFNHFGSAPLFVVVDLETGAVSTIVNKDQHHAHGACNPLKALDSRKVDAVVVGGIGGGALNRLNQSGIRVYRADAASVKENVARLQAQQLREYMPQQCCGGHTHGGGCAH
ncbi:MAG: NifB/NifX family molybdenum-iron cluster-binding protein [Nitrospirota bacterium]